jgi:hypothetical protein
MGQIPDFPDNFRDGESWLRNMGDTFLSFVKFLGGIGRTILSCIWPWYVPRGDGARVIPGPELLNTEPDKFRNIFRNVENHSLLLTAEQGKLGGGLRQPAGTINFVTPGLEARGKEQNYLQLRLPDGVPGHLLMGTRDATNALLGTFTQKLRDLGFVAYKDSLLLLHPPSHMACAIIYDQVQQKLVIHFRDTASDGFWEDGSGANWATNIMQGMGLEPDTYAMADYITHAMTQIFRKEAMQLVGYSMGGGMAFFCGLRYLIPAIGLNSAAPSLSHGRFYHPGWRTFAAEDGGGNMVLVGCANDRLSGKLDNPIHGGVLPTGFPAGMCYHPFPSVGPSPCSAIKAHYLSELLRRITGVAAERMELPLSPASRWILHQAAPSSSSSSSSFDGDELADDTAPLLV